ncbi:MAG: hypothetical protein OQK04_14695, partial [Kangiellaceae bacterium]|nr:hypothetical protein [Kangiellaceae bacterium]
TQAGLPSNIMVDCSHGNSLKDHSRQPLVLEDVVQQVVRGTDSIVGFMLESHLKAGNQKVPKDLAELQYGISITDACIDWQTTEECLIDAADQLRDGDPEINAIRNGVTF